MSAIEKGRIAYISDGQLERQIASEFERIYMSEGAPKKMALFSHVVDGRLAAVSITPESVSFCGSLFGLTQWEECDKLDSSPKFGAVGWEAGDKQLKMLASTCFSGM